jgi:aspartate racemase
MACRLAAAGAELLAIPCNAAHYYLPVIRAAAGVPVLDMLAETVERLPGVRTGLLATTATIHIGLYQRACAARGIEVLVPDGNDQRIVMAMVDAIKAGDAPEAQREHLDRVAARLARRGAESIVIGCTEISLIGGERQEQTRIDALDCLVDATLREATG